MGWSYVNAVLSHTKADHIVQFFGSYINISWVGDDKCRVIGGSESNQGLNGLRAD